MWPEIRIKSSPNVYQSYPNSSQSSFLLKRTFSKLPKSSSNIWATFVRKFVAKNLEISANLVTLKESFPANTWKLYLLGSHAIAMHYHISFICEKKFRFGNQPNGWWENVNRLTLSLWTCLDNVRSQHKHPYTAAAWNGTIPIHLNAQHLST